VREQRVRAMRTIVVAAMLGVATLATVEPAHAGSKECIAAADEGQKLRDDGKLNAARDKFIMCAAKACPGAVAKQCSQWLIEAEHDVPTVTFRALDEQGKETLSVRVLIDGVAVAQSIDARALPIDPGEHAVRFELASGQGVEDKVLVRPGEKNKMIELSFQPKAPPPPAAKPIPAPSPVAPAEEGGGGFHVPMLGWVGLGIGVAGGVMTAIFAVSANSAESDLRSTCAPSCDPSEKSSIDTKIVLANVGLGIGVVGLGLAVVTTVLANTGPKAPPKTATSALRVDVTPGSVLLHGAF